MNMYTKGLLYLVGILLGIKRRMMDIGKKLDFNLAKCFLRICIQKLQKAVTWPNIL